VRKGTLARVPLEAVAAVSAGIVDGAVVLDLCYDEDHQAYTDMNAAMTASGKFRDPGHGGAEAVQRGRNAEDARSCPEGATAHQVPEPGGGGGRKK
jgi:ribonuclease PH